MGWGWTLLMTFPFVVLTSYTYCCGKKDKVVMHVSRLGIATFMWFFWTNLFQYIESNYGRCLSKAHFPTKAACIGKGFMWNGFDLSGHAFILIYSSLVLIEEARAINGWERMSDLIRNEGYTRDTADGSLNVNPLRSLTEREFSNLKAFYEQFTPYIHSLFIGMTCLCILWDVMLVSTMLYYHIMIEKFVSGAIAILMWFVTYRYWYALPKVYPNLPGDGLFKYTNRQQSRELPTKKKTSTPNVAKGQLPKFMGMPLYGLRNQEMKMKDGMKDEKEEQFMDEISPASSSKVSVT
ncbi:Fat storage-inducing transmembrane protein [Gryllus bimaculatus]|nr:Fat storage-inducing transmembrane protein [Gryllus bimaculatus]